MNRFKPHIALLICNIVWAMDYPFYNIVLPRYVHPMAMVSGSLIATALFSLVPLLWQKAEKVAKADVRKLIGAALLIGVLRKVFIMYGLSMTSPIDGSIIDTIVPLLVLLLSVLLGMDRFTKLKIAGLVLGIFLHAFVVKTAEVDMVMFGREIKWLSYLLAAAMTMFFSFLVNLVMGRKMKKIDMVESMKAGE